MKACPSVEFRTDPSLETYSYGFLSRSVRSDACTLAVLGTSMNLHFLVSFSVDGLFVFFQLQSVMAQRSLDL